MKAMCLKKMMRYDEAKATYNKLRDEISRAESKALIRSVFSIIALFTVTDRTKLNDSLENL